jgi:hypothetical protein
MRVQDLVHAAVTFFHVDVSCVAVLEAPGALALVVVRGPIQRHLFGRPTDRLSRIEMENYERHLRSSMPVHVRLRCVWLPEEMCAAADAADRLGGAPAVLRLLDPWPLGARE